MTEKARINHLRRVARRAGLNVAAMRAGDVHVFAILDAGRVATVAVGHVAAERALQKAARI